MNLEKLKKTCPVCESKRVIPLVRIKQMPVHCNLLWPTREASIAGPKGDISLEICENCAHIYNYSFDPALMDYEKEYENSLHYSKVFQEYAENLAEHIVNDFGIRNKRVVEIGSGRGDFLSLVCEIGNNEGIGFDPSYLPSEDDPKNVKIVRDFYTNESLRDAADMICSRHVLEHLENPKAFLASVRGTLDGSMSTMFYIEVPNALYTLRDMGVWDIIYEHCSYFTIASLEYLLQSCGFEVLEIEETYSGQFLGAFARPCEQCAVEEHEDVTDIVQAAKVFSEKYRKKVLSLRMRLEELGASKKRIVVWGAGSKGVTFSNVMGLNRFVPFLVDINPKKWGKHVAGTGQQIIPPDFLKKYQPEIVIILNPLYREEIQNTLVELGLSAEIFVG